jgi:hypothetical protein
LGKDGECPKGSLLMSPLKATLDGEGGRSVALHSIIESWPPADAVKALCEVSCVADAPASP